MGVENSFESPSAGAVPAAMPLDGHDSGPSVRFLDGLGLPTVALMLFISLVLYDQSQSPWSSSCTLFGHENVLIFTCSKLHLAERIDSWSNVQNTLYWSIPGVCRSKVRSVQCEMEEWAS